MYHFMNPVSWQSGLRGHIICWNPVLSAHADAESTVFTMNRDFAGPVFFRLFQVSDRILEKNLLL
jgi:hypothetical protein